MNRTVAVRYPMFALFFLSGITGLVYQIVWTRMLVLVFGNTLLAMSTVLSAFMGGLAAGSFFIGRYIDDRPRPLVKLYAVLEAGIGIYALLFPLLLTTVTPLYADLYRILEGNVALLNLFRFTVCFGLILVPTFLMGATLPVLIKRFTSGGQAIGRQLGWLYGLNTAGAVAGTLACGYFMLRVLGMQGATRVAVAVNLGVAVVAWLISLWDTGAKKFGGTSGVDLRELEVSTRPHSEIAVRMVLIGIGLSGFCALAYEVFWTRMLNLFLHNNIYSFTAMLATFLTGIALGSFLYSRLLARIADQVKLFVGLQLGIGAFAYATPFLFNLLHASLFNQLEEAFTLAKTSVIMIGPTILMGIAVPCAVQICQRGPQREGTSVGTVYAINTVGAILGAFAAGFVLIPFIGLHRGLIFVATLNFLAGFLPFLSRGTKRRRWAWAGAFGALVVGLFALAPPTVFRGLFEKSHPSAEILLYKEGKVANVLVYDFQGHGYKDLHLNAVEEASSRLWHVQLFKLLGILPPILHEDPEEALMIAFGAGMSAGACLGHVSKLTCVDLNPDIDDVAEIFGRENLDVINNPKLERVVNDGRNALLLDPHQYSLIISDATNPKMFDSWTLYTQEFYELAKSRLKPGGIFAQWVLIPLPGDSITVILRTFREVFPHASFWCIYGSTQCIMLGTPERLQIDFRQLSERLEPAYDSSGLAEFGIDSPEKFLSFFMLGEDGLGRLLDGFDKISRDDLPHAQFHIEQDAVGVNASLDLVRHLESISRYLTNLGDSAAQVTRTLDTYEDISRRLHLGFLFNQKNRYREALEVSRKAGLGDDPNTISMLDYGPEKERYFEDWTAQHPDDPYGHNVLGYIQWQKENHTRAITEFQRALEIKPEFANAHLNLARVYLDAGMFEEAEVRLLEVRELNPTRIVLDEVFDQLELLRLQRRLSYPIVDETRAGLLMDLGRAYFEQGDLFRSIAAVEAAAELRPNDPRIFRNLGPLYEKVQFIDEAQNAWAVVAELAPGDTETRARAAALPGDGADRAARKKWFVDRLPRVAEERTEATRPNHPESCRAATRHWNDHVFEESIGDEDLQKAAAEFERTVDADGGHLHAYKDAATIREILGEYAVAAELWHRLLGVSPNHPVAQTNIRRLELQSRIAGGDLDETALAEALAQVASLYRIQGDFERSIDALTRSLEIDSDRANVWAAQAESYAATGRYEDALKAATQALEIEPGLERARRITKRYAPLVNAGR